MKSSLPASKLLIRSVNWLGDAVMTTPALFRLRERFPETEITLLTDRKLADLWTGHPSLDKIITFSKGEKPGEVAARLRPYEFDAALIFPNSIKTALEVWLARIPRRIGYAGQWRSLFLTQRVKSRPEEIRMRKRSDREIKRLIAVPSQVVTEAISPKSHHIHQYLHLAAGMGADPTPVAPLLSVTSAEEIAFGEKWQIPAQPRLIGLNAGAEYGTAKRWPLQNFITAAQMIHARSPSAFMIFGGPADEGLARELEAGLRGNGVQNIYNVAGKTTLRELCVGLKLCQVLLTNDTGPMHVAAALGVPVVVPFGSTSPDLTAPGLPGISSGSFVKGAAPCSPCYRRECPIDFRCMKSISPETIAHEAMKFLKNSLPQ